jgi:hypothetical protein
MGISKAEDVLGPFGDGVATTTVLRYTLETASRADPIPPGWYGQFVRIRPLGGDLFFLFSKNPAAVAANAAAANDGGPSVSRAELVPAGERFDVQIPYANEGETIYFVRLGGTAATSVYFSKASGQPGSNVKVGV